MKDTEEKPIHVRCHELLTGKTCKIRDDGNWIMWLGWNDLHSEWDFEYIPRYDTDIAAAWLLVEAMQKSCAVVQLRVDELGRNLVVVTPAKWVDTKLVKRSANNPFGDDSRETMPRAICAAFIEACQPEAHA